jgi:hypothetical protein
MYQASNVEHLLRAIMGIRAHPRLTTGKTSLGHHGTQFVTRRLRAMGIRDKTHIVLTAKSARKFFLKA